MFISNWKKHKCQGMSKLLQAPKAPSDPRGLNTIWEARAPSTRCLYALKWSIFSAWCLNRGEEDPSPPHCPFWAATVYQPSVTVTQSWYWRRILPPPTIPAGPEIRTHNLPVTSPTRYPLSHDCPNKGLPVTKQRLSRWYSSSGLQCPNGVWAHSTRGIASSWAWSSGVTMTQICAAAG